MAATLRDLPFRRFGNRLIKYPPSSRTQRALAEAMGVPRKHVNELCNDRRAVTAATALILARAFGTSAEFWLNIQRRRDLWEAMNSPRQRERIARAKPLRAAA